MACLFAHTSVSGEATMKFPNRKLAHRSQIEPSSTADQTLRQEPDGYIHANFRHWNWFKPSDQRAQ